MGSHVKLQVKGDMRKPELAHTLRCDSSCAAEIAEQRKPSVKKNGGRRPQGTVYSEKPVESHRPTTV